MTSFFLCQLRVWKPRSESNSHPNPAHKREKGSTVGAYDIVDSVVEHSDRTLAFLSLIPVFDEVIRTSHANDDQWLGSEERKHHCSEY